MSQNVNKIQAPVQTVWEVLANGWSYEKWVVGAKRIRDVDESWPARDSKLYHQISAGPIKATDSTKVLECTPERHIELEGRARPYGVAHITIDLRQAGNATEVTMSERVVNGPGTLLPRFIQDAALKMRNARALQKLARLAESKTL